ncbi:TonB-dependent receptor [Croceibacterium selenioxidans]|nr:TonB-dependent receptor [Croceibacterium selenioxidans]
MAQDSPPAENEIVVTGVRASLDRSIDLKRESHGVVDGISAEDIGKFPDTNLAESLQRITGVSIDRVNGEGSKVTVRGFGPGYNLVTLNGRAIPTASIASIGQDQNGDFVSGTTRSFDFSNVATEGVSMLEVYKTARASVTSGGIGATINIVTRKPLDGEAGFSGSIGAKAVYDSTDTDYARVTPEVSGLLNWVSDDGKFGIGLFGSWQRRNNSAPSASVNDWNIVRYSAFSDPYNSGFIQSAIRVDSNGDPVINPVTGEPFKDMTTTVTGAPSGDTLVAIPNDMRLHYSEFKRERINGQLTLQFQPTDELQITADGTFFQNQSEEQRSDQATWLNRPFSNVVFDSEPVATAISITDVISGAKDGGFEQQYRAIEDRLVSFGLNLQYEPMDNLTLYLDGHYSKAKSLPNNPLGHSSTLVAIAQKGVAGQTLQVIDGFPVQQITFNDNPATGGNGNANGILDLPDLGSQVARSTTSRQIQDTVEVRFDGAWEMGDDDRVTFGAAYRDNDMNQTRTDTYQALGDWGVGNIGDVEQFAPGVVSEFCLPCKFNKFDPQATGALLNSFRADATKLYTLLGNEYPNFGSVNGVQDNTVKEQIWAAYAQVEVNTELSHMPINIVAGVRYERTNSTSISLVTPPSELRWDADNDFTKVIAPDSVNVEADNDYDHILPALDFTSELKGRVSYGKTISRPDFGSLFSAVDIGSNNPNRPTLLGGVPSARSGNPLLVPLVSDNFDVSLEYYFAPTSYVSAGFFDKRVSNFVGTGQENQELFGLRDPSSGAAGTRSGDAAAYLRSIGADLSDVNLFTMTALIDQVGLAGASTQFQANFANGALDQAFVDQVLKAYNVSPNAADPLFTFQVQKPVNNKEGHIYGLEIAGQYFLGTTGFGISGAYTMVNGDIGYDILADPSADQFALLGLSDTANVTLIYENYGFSARLAYNWRDKYLSNNSRGGSRNPVFVAPYDQLDFNLSYDVTQNIALSFEAINITESSTKTFARTENQPWFITEQGRRFYFGARYRF